ncbi:uncharacterized protein METZ01_LOCUS379827, partial [marine metagenome]
MELVRGAAYQRRSLPQEKLSLGHRRTARYKPCVAKPPILDIINLCLERGDTHILDCLNWRIEAGQHWVVLGPNGSGKTSLIAALTGYKSPTSGTIHILGKTYGENDWFQLRKQIGLVSSALDKLMAHDEPVLETIVSGKYAMIDLWQEPSLGDKRAAGAILKRIECSHLANRPWTQLSQGERQRTLIGRALMSKPKLLMLDEPCAGLDPAAREHFLQFLNRLGSKKNTPTIMLITHHLEEIMPVFTHALLLRGGKDIAKGRVNKILTSKSL